MRTKRIIAKLEVKTSNVIKGVRFEGLKIIGKPVDVAVHCFKKGVDELYYVDTVASLYGRNNLLEYVKETASVINIPMTVEGGISSIGDITALLRSGADKIAINTAAVSNRDLLPQSVREFGAQCIVASVYTKFSEDDHDWYIWTDNARNNSGIRLGDWLRYLKEVGVGEVCVNSIDNDGLMEGFDYKLLSFLKDRIDCPLIFSGGCSSFQEAEEVLMIDHLDAVAISSCLYSDRDPVSASCQGRSNALNYEPINHTSIPSDASRVAVIDLGVNNVCSIINCLQHLRIGHDVIRSPVDMGVYDLLILPGSGAFGAFMEKLRLSGLDELIIDFYNHGGRIIGICLGAQILLNKSEETDCVPGLGLVSGEVVSIKNSFPTLKTPHVGWRELRVGRSLPNQAMLNDKLSDSIGQHARYYFTHSYHMCLTNPEYVISRVHGVADMVAIYMTDTVIGMQFHPEKSGDAGYAILHSSIKACLSKAHKVH